MTAAAAEGNERFRGASLNNTVFTRYRASKRLRSQKHTKGFCIGRKQIGVDVELNEKVNF
jgi:hypothetical protein